MSIKTCYRGNCIVDKYEKKQIYFNNLNMLQEILHTFYTKDFFIYFFTFM